MKGPRRPLLFLLLLLALVLLAACSSGTPQIQRETVIVPETVIVRETVVVEVPVTVEVMATPEPGEVAEPTGEAPPTGGQLVFEQLWAESAHADAMAEAFVHWDEDDPAEVPASCAKCHSSSGYQDYLGADGTEAGVVDNAVPVGEVVACVACHNDVTATKDSVVMPSGIELTGLGASARCAECHQGRESTVSVNAAIEAAAVEDVDTVSEDLGFRNIHYFAAAATLYGNEAMGGYQYEGKTYDGKFDHVAGFDSCVECHNPHSLEVKVDQCSVCHTGVTAVEDLREVRMNGSLADYDGDGDVSEGVAHELSGLQEKLLQAIQAYAGEVSGTAIAYNAQSHPYFFIDANENGAIDEGESDRYNAWTPRLLKAAYNYQTSLKDPGAFAHNAKYIIQLVYDSIEDLNVSLAEPVDLTTASRDDPGHFAGTHEAFRHWDEEGVVASSCAKCHSGNGLPFFLEEGVSISQEPTNGLLCATCHSSVPEFTLHEQESVVFPSGAEVSLEGPSTLCLNCHQGRESTVSVNNRIGDLPDDEVSDSLRFTNVHYFAAGATLFGSEVQGAYQYEGKEYAGRFTHVPNYDTCTECHSTHALTVRVDECSSCHPSVAGEEAGLETIRMAGTDYDGDTDTDEGIAGEIATLEESLYAAIQTYATEVAGTSILYNGSSYPYFFTDTNGNGELDADEANAGNSFAAWTPRLLRAAYNYQYAQKDPGDFAHNGQYILQVLYDSLEDIGTQVEVNMEEMTRP